MRARWEAFMRRWTLRKIHGLGRSHNQIWYPELVRFLRSSNPEYRCAAASAMSSLAGYTPPPPAAREALLDAFSDADAKVRREAVSAFRGHEYNSEEIVSRLMLALGDADANVRSTAAGALAWKDASAAAALLPALRDPDATVRRSAANSLEGYARQGKLPQGGEEALRDALKDTDRSVAGHAQRALASGSQAKMIVFIERGDDAAIVGEIADHVREKVGAAPISPHCIFTGSEWPPAKTFMIAALDRHGMPSSAIVQARQIEGIARGIRFFAFYHPNPLNL